MLWKFKKIYQETNESALEPIPFLFDSLISNSSVSDPNVGCSTLTLDDAVFVLQQNVGFITNGDIVYIDNQATSEFIGDDDYYKVKSSNSQTYIVRVSPFGEIYNNFAICT
jgi:hypothetical protein